jgi:hypothetical protein
MQVTGTGEGLASIQVPGTGERSGLYKGTRYMGELTSRRGATRRIFESRFIQNYANGGPNGIFLIFQIFEDI